MNISKTNFKELFRKYRKIDYIQPTTYDINSIKLVLNDSVSNKDIFKKNSDYENIRSTVNKFYLETYSLRNLPKIYWISLPILIVLGFYLIKVLFADFGTYNTIFYKEFLPHIIAISMMFVIILLRWKNDEYIIKSYNVKNNLDIKHINDVRISWINTRYSLNSNFYLLAEKLIKWIEYKESINTNSKFKPWYYVYNDNAKPRIWASIIAMISIVTLIILNSMPLGPDTIFNICSIIVQFVVSPIGISILILIILLYFLTIFIFWMTRTVGTFMLDYIFGQGATRDYKLRVMINFLLDNTEL